MRGLVLSIALLANGAAYAQPAITLQPELGENSLRAERVNNVTGSCGGRQVRVLGFEDSKGDYFRTDAHSGKIIIGRPEGKPSSLIIGSEINAPEVFEGNKVVPFLSDISTVACVLTKGGAKLVIWTNCDGTICGDGGSFLAVDPKAFKILNPPGPTQTGCDANCISKLIGAELPKQLKR